MDLIFLGFSNEALESQYQSYLAHVYLESAGPGWIGLAILSLGLTIALEGRRWKNNESRGAVGFELQVKH